ncbi:hypothetical protein CONCODRAFT_20688 [Conidiobolus coronatus NRRL 28638]|uniref:F-box domain-containing protein n=1 Tax=Conidiobolus coronatus (strain ATCC 28846 / CBS 209.66 / NRRL 28638) TaxID=796925 RepID=A0A137NS22_CONC2|nr:hypothetical protein CONCODRAFT_20688 [Conidiobolus coronatus NRRL 28638]|eukprot:KXN65524.1 hypothetical protein CONCODRAFT_20688 [Conidiobolus coronatus NRRL 28638]
MLSSASIHCKSLLLHFQGLSKLTLNTCEIPFFKFSDLLKKLEILEELDTINVGLLLSPTEVPNSSLYLQFPRSLTKLKYKYIKFGVSGFPETRPLEFVRYIKAVYCVQSLSLLPQHLPNLKSLVFSNRDWDVREFEKFLNMCPALEYVNGPNN